MPALMRLKRNRKLYRPAPARPPGKRGTPRKDRNLFQGSRPETWGEPDASWTGTDWRGKELSVQAWKHLHFRQAREVERHDRVTPRQVRRVMTGILVQVGTPTKVPKPRGKAPGRPLGATVKPAPRYEVVRKPKPLPKKRQTTA